MKTFKVLVIGNSTVGKTCILSRIVHNEFPEETTVTIGNAYLERTVERSKGESVKLRLFDTAGQERFRSVTRFNYKGAHAALLVFDVTSERSFEDLDDWIKDLKTNAPADAKLFVIGNKIDLDQVVHEKTIEGLTKDEVVTIRYVSAKTGDGISELIDDVVNTLDPFVPLTKSQLKVKEPKAAMNTDINSHITITKRSTIKPKKQCC
eukprot:TRINITY_DN9259_c0_g1_i3.p1 TRINITY_DN9259_c0_g1~~TRINITY_DN9259_c0_g1_i3.p1  ORF type:complete len:207 (+),score=36.89 TRINITY_DN9259_c0_g1_i3:64-684(+)